MNIAVFASGRGSNFQAILKAIDDGRLPARVTLLVSNNSNAGALELARSRNIPALHLNQKQFSSEQLYEEQLLDLLARHGVELIVLAGYMKRIPGSVINRFRNRILNIHPALLPMFGGAGMYGTHVHEAVLASGATISGATVHIVDEEYDKGPIVMQKTVEVLSDDTPETLAARVLSVEHEIFPKAIAAFAAKRVRIEGNRVWIQ
jgi:formyltetrahydrofolate-dependent phosphoribosylglycinamide formyltransferase